MNGPDVIVIGAGISGLSFAWKAAHEGRKVLVLEKQERIGGCIRSCRYEDGYWYELGAHTVYNSYSGLLDMVVDSGAADKLVQRGPARIHFGLLRNGTIDWLTPYLILARLDWLEIALHAPFGYFRGKRGRSVKQHYSGFLGPRNFSRVLSPFFAAVPSQCADDFPAAGPGSLFKKRPRRKEFPRSFGFAGGLETACEAAAAHENIEIHTGVRVDGLSRVNGGFEVLAGNGERFWAPLAVVAASHNRAADLLHPAFPKLSETISRVESVTIESLGVRIPRNKCRLPDCAFIVPVDDIFFSAVTRDPFPDPDWRAFAFHFKSGLSWEQKIGRICEVLGIAAADFECPTGHTLTLPAPRVDHEKTIAGIQGELEHTGLALTGNYFNGLAIEDCITRSFAEWERLR